MCGIAGILNRDQDSPVSERDLRRMLALLRHRGPDEFGILLDGALGLGSARLSIVDLNAGQQPITNEDESLWIVFNGEIFNHVELRPELEACGHRFATRTDTEVLLHLYEEYGSRCLERLNGQFAFVIWDTRDQSLFLARDRLGVRPLFYTMQNGSLIFASEIKAILAMPDMAAELNPTVLDQVFTFWAPLSPNTIFRGVSEVPPGHYLRLRKGKIEVKRYWELDFPDVAAPAQTTDQDELLETFTTLLVDATRVRLRADVPVGAYLSGGLDSSTIAYIIRSFTRNRLNTFSIAFDDAQFDESTFQRQMAGFLGTEHQVVRATHEDIGRVFPEVIWHAEVPLMRTAPAPMFMLSKLVRDYGYKVVLTGEGADEFLAGYDIFKEAKIRRFWAEKPDSIRRSRLLARLYPDIENLSHNNIALLAAFFREDLLGVDAPDYSHAVRWRNNRRACRFLSNEVRDRLDSDFRTALAEQLPARFARWEPLARAQFLEIKIFLSQYLLSSQGDRMAMGHSVEGRFPFLDFRLVEFCNRLPARLKLHALIEKYLLKKLGSHWLPPEIWQRGKRPYRAPIHRSFFSPSAPEYVRDLLSQQTLKRTGLFNATAVDQLVRKIDRNGHIGETDEMSLVGILSTQLLHHRFVEKFEAPAALGTDESVKVCLGKAQRSRAKLPESALNT